MSKFIKIGHRGAMGYEPENTLRSFDKAIELGVDMIELDIHLCKTGETVVIHDESVDRTTNGQGLVGNMELGELKLLDAGKGERIPVLEEVLSLVNKRAAVNIELKGRETAQPAADIIRQHVSNGWNPELFIVSSFDWDELREFRRCAFGNRIGVLFNNNYDDLFDFAGEVAAYSIHVPQEKASEDLISDIKRRGFKVFVWTVNEKEDIEKIQKLGADGAFSNFPDRLATR
ncbi:MAG: hypothetical protein A2651_00090 [Candidatus Yanofskybacteria bacterium RIFCSPHIGHO2_01_FULL_42_12]|uniref:GP-PDE domain-containing protein n=1 Tax=Candidatus Yanofskybacteria bacterium RIFCSPLOWO2_01_FULL_42_49 TaxID=1802694 RepID=A0A1F8GEY8_9BACT|nr:MAG: hypothetical protein A2651_00090 [Candidatus Yanofskybacteria bacterium RIFCSPHIGHO2_01_FULL_42_12]OGN23009.1 MAG: hypothetical protein A2918_02660 [Candidatus Yanofskybacteria bacterium RIFCSPLOWO2_01_FULL_42_49]